MKPITFFILLVVCAIVAAVSHNGEKLLKSLSHDRPDPKSIRVGLLDGFNGRFLHASQVHVTPAIAIETSPTEIAAAGKKALLLHRIEEKNLSNHGSIVLDGWTPDPQTAGAFLHSTSVIEPSEFDVDWFSPDRIEFASGTLTVNYRMSDNWRILLQVSKWIFYVNAAAFLFLAMFGCLAVAKKYPRLAQTKGRM